MFTHSIIMGIPANATVWIILFLAVAFVVALALLLGRGLTFEKDANGHLRFRIRAKEKNTAHPKSIDNSKINVQVLNDAKVGGNVDIGKVVGSEQTTHTSEDKSQ